jgi:hypothetical protein
LAGKYACSFDLLQKIRWVLVNRNFNAAGKPQTEQPVKLTAKQALRSSYLAKRTLKIKAFCGVENCDALEIRSQFITFWQKYLKLALSICIFRRLGLK